MKLPGKTRILQYAIQRDNNDFTTDDVLRTLQQEYPGERMINQKQIQEYIDSLVGVGFFKATSIGFDEQHELQLRYVVTDYGKSRQKYIH